jgi:hypothetical protein
LEEVTGKAKFCSEQISRIKHKISLGDHHSSVHARDFCTNSFILYLANL